MNIFDIFPFVFLNALGAALYSEKDQFYHQNLKPFGLSGSAHLLCCRAFEVVKIHLHALRLEYEPIRKSQNLGEIKNKL